MIGPVSGTGRAMMASLQQAIQKGMPPDQAVQYVKSMATQGVAPLADLYAMMNQFQRLKEPQVKPPQTPPTIKDQLNALDKQRSQQGNIQQMQAPAPQPQPMDRGLGAIDAGLMEYPKFAGGGIIAFDNGGTASSGFDIEGVYSRGKPEGYGQFGAREMEIFTRKAGVEDLARLFAMALSRNDFDTASRLEPYLLQKGVSQSELGEIRKRTAQGVRGVKEAQQQIERQNLESQFLTGQSAVPPTATLTPPAPVDTPPAPVVERRPSVMGGPAITPPPAETDITDEQYEKLQAFRKREGLGAAREEMRQFLTGEERRLERTYGEDKRLAFAEVGFKMAAAASRPGATFLGALSEGAMSGTQAMRAINKELADNKRLLKQSMIKLKEADELEKEGDYKTAMGLNREARAEAVKLYELRENLKMDREKIAAQREATAATREYTMASQEETRDLRRRALKQNILENTNYPMLRMKLSGLDPEENKEQIAQIRSQMTELERKAEIDAGMRPEDVTAASDAIAELQRLASARGLTLVPNQ